MSLIRIDSASRTFETPAGSFTALRDLTLEIERGEFVAVTGPSGSGKSTLLGLIAGIDRPTSGEVTVAGTSLSGLSEGAMSAWRGRTVGIVFQFFQLLPTLTAQENVMLPMDFCGTVPTRHRPERAMELLERVGVADQARKLPGTLSGGQQQRVAIARALANEPPVLLADEPTGNLDSRTAGGVLDVFARLATAGQTVVMATHDRAARTVASRIVALADGLVVPDEVLA